LNTATLESEKSEPAAATGQSSTVVFQQDVLLPEETPVVVPIECPMVGRGGTNAG
jgi:hypothetical protein